MYNRDYPYRYTSRFRKLRLTGITFLLLLPFLKVFSQSAIPDSTVIGLFDIAGDLSKDLDNLPSFKFQKLKLVPLNKATSESRLQLARNNNRPRGVAAMANNLGLIYFKEGNYIKALDYFKEALIAREQTGDRKGIALNQAEIGYVAFVMKNFNLANDYFTKSLIILKEEKATHSVAIISELSGECYLKTKDYNQAIDAFKQAILSYSESGKIASTSNLWNKTGEILLIQRKYEGAVEHFKTALQTAISMNDSLIAARANRNLGIIALYEEDYLKAETYMLSSLKFKPNASLTLKYLKETYSKLAAKYKVESQEAKAFYYNQRYQTVKNQIQDYAPLENKNNKPAKIDADEKEYLVEQLHKEPKQQYSKLSQNELEMKQLMTSTELERLNNEKAVEELNRSLHLSEQVRLERDQEIEKLKDEKVQLDLLLAQNERELFRKSRNNFILLGTTLLVLLLAFFIYNRYRFKKKSLTEIHQAFSELKAAQQQLIQSEKMASLGQLTAGIAHEIQNPLNFVNNFSELNVELLDEFEKAESEGERLELINNLKNNFLRIHEHGKRADSIVKAMLSHSRAGNNEKQLVSINKLCDEFFNLAYHGMRAMDSSFNCVMNKSFSEGLPEIKVIPQDISRVLLNLFNNAFYAVNEKARKMNEAGEAGYNPMVTLSTALINKQVQILVKDNGGGIPADIIKKIFNPFFTTKPTGKGTGLGLALSYDIVVKGHQGALTVESGKETGTVFTVSLPVG